MVLKRSNRVLGLTLLALFLLLVAGIMLVGYRYYTAQLDLLKAEATVGLRAVANVKVQQLVTWREERIRTGEIIQSALHQFAPIQEWMRDAKKVPLRRQLTDWLESVKKMDHLSDIIILDREGRTLLSLLGRDYSPGPAPADAAPVLNQGKVVVTDLHIGKSPSKLHLDVLIPLYATADSQQTAGMLILAIPVAETPVPGLQQWPGKSQSAETLLIRRDPKTVYYLNQQRHRPTSAEPLQLPVTDQSLPAARAALGWEGVFEGRDYRGVPVLAVVRRVPDSPWSIVTKMDMAEVYGEQREQLRNVAFIGALIAAVGGLLMAYIWHSITLRNYQRLVSTEQEYRGVLATSLDGFFTCDTQGRILDPNPALSRMLGYEPFELASRNLSDIVVGLSHDSMLDRIEQVRAIRIMRFESKGRRKDGEILDIDLSAYWPHVESGRFYVFVRDLTDTRRLQAQLLQAQKLDSIARLAGGVAHDFNNLLTVVNGYSDLMLTGMADDSPYRRPLTEISKAGQRAAALTQQLLDFSRRQQSPTGSADVNAVVRDARNLLSHLLGEDIHLEMELDPAVKSVKADPSQIHRTLVNLALNARDAMPAGGRFAIQTAREPESARVLLKVSDTGQGMDEETRKHIFEPFFTTKPMGQGTGLGLATVYGIVKQFDGTIEVQSEPGDGTVFLIRFPEANGPEGAPTEPPEPVRNLRGEETILLVEDQPEVRRLASLGLATLGYRVIEAKDGLQALERLRENKSAVRLMLTDVVMPGMDGARLAEEAQLVCPGLPVVFTSGYQKGELTQHREWQMRTGFLAKPFTADQLASKIRELLG
jgi:PAS domain S-box-containing protein